MGFKRTIVDLLAPYPRVFFPLARIFAPRKYRGHLVDPRDELVISGFPRSANTYAVFAFLEAQGRPVSIARHLHVEAEVLEAARRGIPAIVLIRRPEDAIRSLVTAIPGWNENRALTRWIKYYTRIEPYGESFVVAEFDRATNDFGSVIDEVNRRFGTRFRRFEPTEENQQRVFARMKHDQETLGTQRFAAVPGDGREAVLKKSELNFDPNLLARANAIYESYRAIGEAPFKPSERAL